MVTKACWYIIKIRKLTKPRGMRKMGVHGLRNQTVRHEVPKAIIYSTMRSN
jgi:hypothetical protein